MILYVNNTYHKFCKGTLLTRDNLWANETVKVSEIIHRQTESFTLQDVIDIITGEKEKISVNDKQIKFYHKGAYEFIFTYKTKHSKTYFHFEFGNLKSDWRLWDKFGIIP